MSSYVSEVYESNDQNVYDVFLNTFQLLPEKQKKIWQILNWYAVHYRNVFPSHATIAEKVGCCRDTVIQAIKKFTEWGWIGVIKRCFRSNMYFMRECLKKFDTRKNETFRLNPTENPTAIPTVNPTLYNTYSSSCNVRSTSGKENSGTVQDINPEKEQILRKIGIHDAKDIWCLSRFSPKILNLAAEDEKTRKAKWPIINLAAWITDRCNKLRQKYGN